MGTTMRHRRKGGHSGSRRTMRKKRSQIQDTLASFLGETATDTLMDTLQIDNTKDEGELEEKKVEMKKEDESVEDEEPVEDEEEDESVEDDEEDESAEEEDESAEDEDEEEESVEDEKEDESDEEEVVFSSEDIDRFAKKFDIDRSVIRATTEETMDYNLVKNGNITQNVSGDEIINVVMIMFPNVVKSGIVFTDESEELEDADIDSHNFNTKYCVETLWVKIPGIPSICVNLPCVVVKSIYPMKKGEPVVLEKEPVISVRRGSLIGSGSIMEKISSSDDNEISLREETVMSE